MGEYQSQRKTNEFRQLFPRRPSSAGGARRFVTEVLRGCASQLDFDAAVLLADELATNAIVHATGESFALVVVLDLGAVRIAVEDDDPTPPRLADREPPTAGGSSGGHPGGMGLPIVRALSDAWGVSPNAAGGKGVWFQLNRSPCQS
ncbi:MAG: ATP-binding protein [Actinomycetota bacterium]